MTFYNTIGTENIEFRYSSPTFTIGAVGGRDLSSSNPGYVIMPGDSFGNVVRVPVTSNQDFIDDGGASEIINNLFGLTTGVAYANTIPFCVYAVLSDDESSIAFMISRRFGQVSSPAASDIGAPDDAVADGTSDFWSLENITETNYDLNPALPIGSFRMVMSASDDWTVQSFVLGGDGVGFFQENNVFTVSAGHFGAASGKYFEDQGGTAPGFSGNDFQYFVTKDGMVHVNFSFQTCNVAGAGAGNATVSMPFAMHGSIKSTVHGSANYSDNSSGLFHPGVTGMITGTNDCRIQDYILDNNSWLTNDAFDSDDSVFGTIIYKM